jgi:predicted dehydrogenase
MVRTPDDARELLSLVRDAGIPMASFTTLRYGSDTERYAEGFRNIGPVRYASYVGPAHRTHPYGGFEFYAVHSVEVMLQFHGTDVVSVQAIEHRPGADRSNTIAACAFGDGTLVMLGLVGDGAYHFRMTAIGRDGVVDVARAMYPESVDATGLAAALGHTAGSPDSPIRASAADRPRSDHYPVGLRKILAVLRGEEPNPISHEEMLLTVQISAAIE